MNKIAKTQGEKNSRPQKLKGNFAQKLKVPELFQICNSKKLEKLLLKTGIVLNFGTFIL